jgi:hypothetical protein
VPSHLLEPALDCARAREQLPVELFETVVRSKEHKPARHADGDADGPPLIFDGETLN